ncbi:hypothetical protein M404DRAFT_1000559 [Pisolithus tinctorius Marx 270]|uniref:Uncharacterized protein n=1 Tax=Pisolithus tinctorius Marx 270 TaxID=870435 RepID=A0A0C3P9E8_PISTI|nr:hypothetical protein M404DRAFT_1000559 [Pisolithus tinctorius Marx 270]
MLTDAEPCKLLLCIASHLSASQAERKIRKNMTRISALTTYMISSSCPMRHLGRPRG